MAHPDLLHPELFNGPFDTGVGHALERQLREVPAPPSPDERPSLTVLVQSCNDTPAQMERLMTDINQNAAAYGADKVHRVVVAIGSMWNTAQEKAEEHGATIVTVNPHATDLRSRVLREGLEAAPSDVVFTTVGHAALSNTRTLTMAAHHMSRPEVGGAFGLPFRDSGSTFSESAGARLLGLDIKARQGVTEFTKPPEGLAAMGLMGADFSVLRRSTVEQLKGFDESFGAGGHDGAFAAKMLEAGLTLVRDPLLGGPHTHRLNPGKSLRQVAAWLKMGESRDYDATEWAWHPNQGF